VRPGVGLVDPVGPGADDSDQLDLPVDRAADELDVVERARQRAGNFVNVAGTLGTAMPDSSAWLR
jgi:hypothetical protein